MFIQHSATALTAITLMAAALFLGACAAGSAAPVTTPTLVALIPIVAPVGAGATTAATEQAATSAPTATSEPPTATPSPLPTWTPIATPQPDTLVVDAARSLGPISPNIYGTNYGPWVSLRIEIMPLAEQAGITVIRYPGGEWGDHNKLQTYQIDQLVDLARRMGAEPFLHIRFLDSTPEQAAAIVQYAKDKGYNIRFWSIGNEPSLYERGGNLWTADTFAQEWRKFADAMKAVDPNILLIGPENHQYTGNPDSDPKDSKGQDWLRTFLEVNGDKVDIVSVHRYPFPLSANAGAATVEQLRANPPQWDEIVRNLRDVVRELTGRDLPVAVTEFNSHWTRSSGGETTPDSLLSALWLGDVLGRLIEQRVDLATQFLLVSGSDHSGFGILDRYEARPAYYVYQLYKQFGQELFYASSGIENVSVHAARRDDGTLTILAINLGDATVTRPLQLSGFTPSGDAQVYRFDADHKAEQLEDQPLADGAELTLPPQSMTLYVVK